MSLLCVFFLVCSHFLEACSFVPPTSFTLFTSLQQKKRNPCAYFRRWDRCARREPFDDDGFEETDATANYDTRLVGDSDAARELREMRYEEEDYYSDEDDESYPASFEEEDQSRFREYDEVEDERQYIHQDTEDFESSEETGNYWSNPKRSLDPYPDQDNRSTRQGRKSRPASTAVPHRRRPRRRKGRRSRERTTFRSGTPSPPGALEDFYRRLFWYGFDTEDIASTSDRTVFGGSRGKFHGLEYMKQISGKPMGTPHREKRTPRTRPLSEAYDEESVEFADEDYYGDFENDDDEYRYTEDKGRDSYRSRETRPSRRKKPNGDWVTQEVSSWFLPGNDRRTEGRGRRRKKESSPWNIVEQILNLDDDDEVKYQAEMYNRRVNMGSENRRTREQSQDSGRQRRPGYAYPYVNDDSPVPVVDVQVDDVELPREEDGRTRSRPGGEDSSSVDSVESGERRTRSWTDRAQAVERVPPSGVDAWGPSGEIGLDARTKATLDALEEIRTAKRKVEARENRATLAKENMVVVRADAELQKKRLRLANKGSRVRELIRQIEMDVDDAAMALRRAKAQAASARDQLAELEESHWALLSLYDADKAFREVVKTIQETELTLSGETESVEKISGEDDTASDSDADSEVPFTGGRALDGATRVGDNAQEKDVQ